MSKRFLGAIWPSITQVRTPREVSARIIRDNCPTRTHSRASTSDASAGSVSPSKPTATTDCPLRRASRANRNGRDLLPAIKPITPEPSLRPELHGSRASSKNGVGRLPLPIGGNDMGTGSPFVGSAAFWLLAVRPRAIDAKGAEVRVGRRGTRSGTGTGSRPAWGQAPDTGSANARRPRKRDASPTQDDPRLS